MTNKLDQGTFDFIINEMETLVKNIMYDTRNTPEYILDKIGQFRGLLYLLANSGYESYGLKFKVIVPTNEDYASSLPIEDDES